MNVGAKSITDYGLYFQWGDTQGYTADQVGTGEGKKEFSSGYSDYKWYDASNDKFTKYNTDDNKTVLDLKDDAVNAAWGGFWKMPTKDDFLKLEDAVTTTFETNYQGSGVNGLLCTAKDDSNKILFFPACGRVFDGIIDGVKIYGSYWLSLVGERGIGTGYELSIYNKGTNLSSESVGNGCAVRGVLDDKQAKSIQ